MSETSGEAIEAIQVFVTGTDTEVGKTVVSTILALGLNAHYWKPIQAGLAPQSDSQFASRWLAPERVLPEMERFRMPASPHLAAAAEGKTIDFRRHDRGIWLSHQRLVVEGAGGILVPLNQHHMMIDLMRYLNLPVVVVTRAKLGLINHTLMTLECLRRRDLLVAGVIIVGAKDTGSRGAIEYYGDTTVIGEIPVIESFSKKTFLEIYRDIDTRSLRSEPFYKEQWA
jgi:dethiobiotin synthetase